MLTAIETTGKIEQNGRIVIDEVFSVNAPISVKVIVLFPENNEEVNENEWMRAAKTNEAFDFLNEADEDIYSLTDGKPLDK